MQELYTPFGILETASSQLNSSALELSLFERSKSRRSQVQLQVVLQLQPAFVWTFWVPLQPRYVRMRSPNSTAPKTRPLGRRMKRPKVKALKLHWFLPYTDTQAETGGAQTAAPPYVGLAIGGHVRALSRCCDVQ